MNDKRPVSDLHKKSSVLWFVLGSLLLVGMILGASFTLRASSEQPRPVAADSQATTVTIPIEGMSCASCVARVKKTLQAIEGVTAVEVSLAQRAARVSYLEARVSPEHLAAAIADLGYKAGTPTAERAR